MAKGKKYDFNVVQTNDTWTAEIVRQITSKKTVISKSQDGFSSEAEAQAWGETELKGFLQHQIERNKRRVKPVVEQAAPEEAQVSDDTESDSE